VALEVPGNELAGDTGRERPEDAVGADTEREQRDEHGDETDRVQVGPINAPRVPAVLELVLGLELPPAAGVKHA